MLVWGVIFAFLQLSSFAARNVRCEPGVPNYHIVVDDDIVQEIKKYGSAFKLRPSKNIFQTTLASYLTCEKMIEALLRIKQPAGSTQLSTSFWTKEEFQFLSYLSIAVNVTAVAVRKLFNYERTDYDAILIFTNYYCNSKYYFGLTPESFGKSLIDSKYYESIMKRLFPILSYINSMAVEYKAIVTIPVWCWFCGKIWAANRRISGSSHTEHSIQKWATFPKYCCHLLLSQSRK